MFSLLMLGSLVTAVLIAVAALESVLRRRAGKQDRV